MGLFDATTIVIVNGYNVDSADWKFVMEGDSVAERLGRIPKAIHVALAEQADHMLWNTGASKRMWGEKMVYEGEFNYRFALDNLREWMQMFPAYFDDFSYGKIESFLRDERKHHFEIESTNTLTSAYKSVPILNRLVAGKHAKVITVSSRNHTRAGHHFQMVLEHGHGGHGPLECKTLDVYHVCSHTGYAFDGPMECVQINECSGEDRYTRR